MANGVLGLTELLQVSQTLLTTSLWFKGCPAVECQCVLPAAEAADSAAGSLERLVEKLVLEKAKPCPSAQCEWDTLVVLCLVLVGLLLFLFGACVGVAISSCCCKPRPSRLETRGSGGNEDLGSRRGAPAGWELPRGIPVGPRTPSSVRALADAADSLR